MTISKLIEEAHETAKEKGFWEKPRTIGEILMLIVSELGEALEADRNSNYGLEKKDTFEDEIADTFIRLADLCGGLEIDIERQIKWKLIYNKNRPKLHNKNY